MTRPRRNRWWRPLRLAMATALAAAGCSTASPSELFNARSEAPAPVGRQSPLRPETPPSEYTGITESIPVTRASFDRLASGVFGAKARRGDFGTIRLSPGVTLAAAEHPDASDQVVWTVSMRVTDQSTPRRRNLAVVPVGLDTGSTFIAAVDAALAEHRKVVRRDRADAEPFTLDYRATSANGGMVRLSVVVNDAQPTPIRLEIQATSPTTSLVDGDINTPAREGKSFEAISGLVWFGVTRDNFDFFVDRAYGLSAGKNQNFSDFELVPHNWLRLTVTPQLDDDRVNVAFDVVTLDGDRIPIASAPASLVAGEQFKQNVFRMFDDAARRAKSKPGAAGTWEAPFYYDDPAGGGVVEVIAKGRGDTMRIAYSVQSPEVPTDDVEFVPYQGTVEVPDDWDAPPPSCKESGANSAPKGRFDIRFVASSTVRNSKLKAPLRGNVYGAVYKAEDVKITGPIKGAKPVATIRFRNVDVRRGPSKRYRLDTLLPSGTYQVLGFLDIDGDAKRRNPNPDVGDPVFIPIGGFTMECDVQAITAEFALTLPPGQ